MSAERGTENGPTMSATRSIDFTNQFLIAMPGMADDTFAGAVVYLCEHTDKGALGLVINKPIDIKLRNLFEKVELTLDRADLADAAGATSAARCRPSAASCCTSGCPRTATASHYNSSLPIPGGARDDHQQGRAGGAVHGAGPRRCWSRWATAAGAPASSRKRSAATAGSPSTPTRVIFDTPIEQRYDRALSLLGIDPRMLSQEAGHA